MANATEGGKAKSYVDTCGAHPRLLEVQAMFDAATKEYMETLGLAPGWRCFELGAGAGSIAKWLSEKVAPGGSVLATDIDTRMVAPLAGPGLTVSQHNVLTDPVPQNEFDLVHARLVINVLPVPEAQRAEVMSKLVTSLKPGGWMLIESWDWTPANSSSELWTKMRNSAIDGLRGAGGINSFYGRGIGDRLREVGLVDVQAQGRIYEYSGGSPLAKLFKSAWSQVKPRIVAANAMTEAEVDGALALLDDPSFHATSPIMMSGWGRKPG